MRFWRERGRGGERERVVDEKGVKKNLDILGIRTRVGKLTRSRDESVCSRLSCRWKQGLFAMLRCLCLKGMKRDR